MSRLAVATIVGLSAALGLTLLAATRMRHQLYEIAVMVDGKILMSPGAHASEDESVILYVDPEGQIMVELVGDEDDED